MDLLDLYVEPTRYRTYRACSIADVGSLNFSGYYGEDGYASILPATDCGWAALNRACEILQEVFWREYVDFYLERFHADYCL